MFQNFIDRYTRVVFPTSSLTTALQPFTKRVTAVLRTDVCRMDKTHTICSSAGFGRGYTGHWVRVLTHVLPADHLDVDRLRLGYHVDDLLVISNEKHVLITFHTDSDVR